MDQMISNNELEELKQKLIEYINKNNIEEINIEIYKLYDKKTIDIRYR